MGAVGTETRSYFAASRSHRYSLLFALPLLVTYELLEAVAPVRSHGGVIRNGADVLLTGAFISLFGPRGPLIFMALVIGISVYLIWRDRKGPMRPRYFGVMFAESALLSVVFGVVVGMATMRILGLSSPATAPSALAKLTLSIGAGLYEELLFRVILVALIANAMRFIGFSKLFAGIVATVLGAVIFSAFHYIGSLGDTFTPQSFVFRTVAGLAFSAMYLLRGFGITAWTHALYDIAVMM
jgi:hypothetical protein